MNNFWRHAASQSIKELPDWCFRQEFVTMFYLSSIGEHMEDAVGGEEAICANLDKTKLGTGA